MKLEPWQLERIRPMSVANLLAILTLPPATSLRWDWGHRVMVERGR